MGKVLGDVEGKVGGELEGCALRLFLGLVDSNALGNGMGEVEGKIGGELESYALGLLI